MSRISLSRLHAWLTGRRPAVFTMLGINVAGGALAASLLFWTNGSLLDQQSQQGESFHRETTRKTHASYLTLAEKIPAEADLNGRLQQILEAGRKYGLAISNIQPVTHGDPAQGPLGLLAVSLSLAGKYSDLIGFVDTLENGKFPLRISQLSMETTREPGLRQLSLVVTALTAETGSVR